MPRSGEKKDDLSSQNGGYDMILPYITIKHGDINVIF